MYIDIHGNIQECMNDRQWIKRVDKNVIICILGSCDKEY